jgi:hypothetical protein
MILSTVLMTTIGISSWKHKICQEIGLKGKNMTKIIKLTGFYLTARIE